MPIILSQTYEIVTEESAQDGEAAERGYDWQDVPHSFRETVELINDGGFTNPSDSHGVPRWLSDGGYQDCQTGEWDTKSLHPGTDARSQRYWEKAVRAAGMLKDSIYWRDMLKGIHANGLRAEVTYRTADGYVVKGLALQEATKGIGPDGRWFVWVNNFANTVALDDVLNVKKVEK